MDRKLCRHSGKMCMDDVGSQRVMTSRDHAGAQTFFLPGEGDSREDQPMGRGEVGKARRGSQGLGTGGPRAAPTSGQSADGRQHPREPGF